MYPNKFSPITIYLFLLNSNLQIQFRFRLAVCGVAFQFHYMCFTSIIHFLVGCWKIRFHFWNTQFTTMKAVQAFPSKGGFNYRLCFIQFTRLPACQGIAVGTPAFYTPLGILSFPDPRLTWTKLAPVLKEAPDGSIQTQTPPAHINLSCLGNGFGLTSSLYLLHHSVSRFSCSRPSHIPPPQVVCRHHHPSARSCA